MRFMRTTSLTAACGMLTAVILLGPTAKGLFAQAPSSDSDQQAASQDTTAKLLEEIKSDSLTAEKAAAFENLAVFGTVDAVPVLAELLSDTQVSHYARFSLESMPYPEVDAVFRQALGQLDGKLLIGVINSIGVRQDAAAIPQLTELLNADSADVAAAAANSLGHIATEEAAQSLRTALADGAADRKSACGLAAIVCAEKMADKGLQEAATALYDQVRQANVHKNIQLAGLRGAILARGDNGLAMLTEQLKSEDPQVVDVALRAAREMAGPATTQALIAQLDKLPEPTTALVIILLGDLQDDAALPAVAAAAENGGEAVRLAAIQSLQHLGDATVLPVVWQAARQPDPSLSEAAMATLASLPGETVDTAILEKLNAGDAGSQETAVILVGKRRIPAAVPRLRELADSASGSLKMAAIRALGETVSLEGIDGLIDRVIAAQGDAETALAVESLKAACVRMPDREATVQALAKRIPNAPKDVKVQLVALMSPIGGEAAVQYLISAAKSSDPVVQNKATEVLGVWVGAGIGPALFELIQAREVEKYRIRLLRGYIRLARQFGLPPEEAMTICGNALRVADRQEEKLLTLETLGRYPVPAALELAVTQLDDPEAKDAAAARALAIATEVARTDAAAVKGPLEKVLEADVSSTLKQQAEELIKQ
jgi:HEAT repeat protein